MKELKLLQEELAIMRTWQGECKRLELDTAKAQIVIIEHALQSAEAKITEEYAEEITWAKKAAQANYKDAEANIAETVYYARIGWFRKEVAKMESELKKLRRKAKKTLRELDELDAEAKRFNNGTLKANTDDEAKQNAC